MATGRIHPHVKDDPISSTARYLANLKLSDPTSETSPSYRAGHADGYAGRRDRGAADFNDPREAQEYTDGYADGTQARRFDIEDGHYAHPSSSSTVASASDGHEDLA